MKIKNRRVFAATAGAMVLGLAMSLQVSAQGGEATTQMQIDVAAQPLAQAIQAIARQTSMNILVDPKLVEGRDAPAVKAQMSVNQALNLLLQGTGLTPRYVDDKTITLVAAGTPVKASEVSQVANLRLAQEDQSKTEMQKVENQNSPENTSPSEPSAEGSENKLDEIVVTGSHIRGVSNIGAQLIEITREDIDRSGYATSHEIIQSLPQNFGGGASEDPNGIDGGGASANLRYGSGVNLRGLGNDSTLVLMNGRRLAMGGAGAHFVDVSMIPLSAVERVEVLTDGASALYGSDAVGGVVNYVMRKDYQGAESRLRFGSVTSGHSDERQFGQVFGRSWGSGSALFAYEYYERDNLASEDREYAADSDLTRFGGDNWRSQNGNPGNILDPATFAPAFAIPRGQDGTSLSIDDLLPGVVNLQNSQRGTDLLPRQKMHGAFFTLDQEVTSAISLFADARYSQRKARQRFPGDQEYLLVPSSNAFFVDPFGGSDSFYMTYSFIDDLGSQTAYADVKSYGGTAGVNFKLWGAWQAQLFGSYGAERANDRFASQVDATALAIALADSNPATAFNPFGDGSYTNPATLQSLRMEERNFANSDLKMAHFKLDGGIFAMPAGQAKLAVGAEYRAETLDVSYGTNPPSDREVLSGFAELYVPLFDRPNSHWGLRRLEISLAGRAEDYSDFGSTADPRLGLVWSPFEGLVLRGTVGRSFKAPILGQLYGYNQLQIVPGLPDTHSPTQLTNVLAITGLQSDLQPEKAKTWTAGLQIQPIGLRALDVQLNYFNIEIADRIASPSNNLITVLENEAEFSSILERNPSAQRVEALYQDPDFIGGTIPADQVGAVIDLRQGNTALNRMRGLDLSITYGFHGGLNEFTAQFGGTYLIDLKRALTPTAPLMEQVDTILNPAALKLRSSLSWTRGGAGVTAFVNYIDSYTDPAPTTGGPIDAWTTVDLNVTYSTGQRFGTGLMSDVKAALTVRNVLDEDPPFVNITLGIGYDAMNADPQGRLISLQIVKQWQ